MPLFFFPSQLFLFFPPSQLFLSFAPLLFQACPAQPLWTTNGADPRGTARPGTSTGDTDYLWIVRQCRDSAGLLQNVSVVCKTELFAKTECPRAHKVSPQLAAWAWNEMWGKKRSQAPVARNLDTLAKLIQLWKMEQFFSEINSLNQATILVEKITFSTVAYCLQVVAMNHHSIEYGNTSHGHHALICELLHLEITIAVPNKFKTEYFLKQLELRNGKYLAIVGWCSIPLIKLRLS